MAKPVRVRLAPSPTGPIHVGNLHTGLFNWLYARSLGGTFILRFEDTDQERSRKEWEEVIFQEMRWLGLDWDEGADIGGPYGPYRQMERLDVYREYAQRLLDSGDAYYCYCTPEELDAERQEAQKKGAVYQYSRKCRHLTPAERGRHEAAGRRPVIRYKVPDGETVVFDDLIRGPIETPTDSIGDFIVVRSSGIPIYNFAVVIDDVTMEITHIIRGEGHISNTPQQLLIYRALGLEPPRFGHAGHILGKDRAKLSKRNGDAFVGDYRDRGYLPEALLNFMALLGWTPEDGREFLTKAEMIQQFTLDRVTKAPSVFDPDKLDWMNGNYIRSLPLDELSRRSIPFLQKEGLLSGAPTDDEWDKLLKIMATVQERIKTLAEVPGMTDFFFRPSLSIDPDAAKLLTPESCNWLRQTKERLESLENFEVASIEATCRALVDELGLKAKAVFQPLRVAITGRTVSPPLFESMALLGKTRVLDRLTAVI
ncbi:MAG: glutamate--tRNA ligase [Symbiobacteriia bacterium]